MKIFAELPEGKHYRLMPHTEKIIFFDRASSLIEIESPVPQPWGKPWKILLGIKWGKNVNVRVAGKIKFKLISANREDAPLAKIERSITYGKVTYTPTGSRHHTGIPIDIINRKQLEEEPNTLPTYKWLEYDIYLI